MTNPQIIEHEWTADARPLPSETDFDPYGGNLDAQCAWKNFGGLTRSEAYARFLENPCYYQEDFMFMGGAAFVYYFPVIERFLLEAVESDEPEDREAWILAKGISIQLCASAHKIQQLSPRIFALAKHVRSNLRHYSAEEEERQSIDTAWAEVEARLAPGQGARDT